MTEKFELSGLHCANCGEKIRAACEKLDGVSRAKLNIASGMLTLETDGGTDADALAEKIQAVCDRIEGGITVNASGCVSREKHGCHAHGHCGCGEHEHGHDGHAHSHEHGHEHSHEHSHSHSSVKTDIAVIAVSAVLALAAVISGVLKLGVLSAVLFSVSAAVAVARPAVSGIRGLFHLDIDENVLLFIAVVAAVCIGEYAEAAIVSLLFAVGQYIEAAVSDKSRGELKKISEIRPDTAHTDNGDVHAEQVKIGDEIIIRPFERIPLDGTVISGSGQIDASAITGESVPVTVECGTQLLGGMLNGAGVLRVKVTGDYHDSAAARIVRLVEDSVENKGMSERFITKFARIYTPCMVIAAILVTLIPSIILGGFSVEWLRKSLVFLVASCPCALVISVPLAFYAGVGAASRKGVLIKGGAYIEQLADARAAAFDKTGTLTTGELSVVNVVNLTGEDVLSIAAAAEAQSDHPVARAICAACGEPAALDGDISERAGFGVTVDGTRRVTVGAKRFMQAEGVDISALPDAAVYVAADGVCLGCISVADTLRADSKPLIDGLRSRGFSRIAMLSGDNAATAETVAAQCGIDEVHAGLLPEDKVSVMQEITEKSGGAIFLGDGINDAPVIAAASAGVAMGLGTDAAIETADAVLTSGNPYALLTAVDVSRRTMRTVKFNIAVSIIVKLAVIVSAFFYTMMWAAVVADVVLSVACSLNSARLMADSGKSHS